MKIKEILAKVAKGEELTEEEKKALSEYDPEKDENRIPKSRLDEVNAKLKAEQEKASGFESKIAELTEKLEKLETDGMSEAEKAKAQAAKELKKLQTDLDNATKERDAAKADLAKMERTAKINAISSKHNFSNAQYLDFLADSKKLDIDNEASVNEFMTNLGKEMPELFKSTVKSGGGTGGGGGDDVSSYQKRIDELFKKDSLTEKEAGEIIDLNNKIAEANASGGAGGGGQS